jgi:hypothetical protein
MNDGIGARAAAKGEKSIATPPVDLHLAIVHAQARVIRADPVRTTLVEAQPDVQRERRPVEGRLYQEAVRALHSLEPEAVCAARLGDHGIRDGRDSARRCRA